MPASVPASSGGGVAQSPALHDPESQMMPHPPQLLTSAVTSVQPLEQAKSPAGHAQAPPLATMLHVSPVTGHAPQAAPPAPHDVLLCDAKSSHVFPLQQPDPHEAAVHWQIPERHCCVAAHWMPHEPQLLTSVLVLTHALPHGLSDPLHTHAPPLQLAPSGHG